ncbi:MAG: hypothetical protein H7288_11330 [Kineosporiaceae bacterium]|nr:hypothetical protein [Aeromicrobium sp.]
MTAHITGNIRSTHLPASSRDDQPPEHTCPTCRTPYGRSSIKCPNEPLTPVERAMAWVAKRAEMKGMD